MAYPIKHDYKDGAIAVIRGRVWNAVARICSYWASGNYITIRKPENPSGQTPIVWDLDCIAAAPEIAHEFHAQDLWDHNVYPFALRVILNSAKTAVSAVRIFLPGTCARINGVTCSFDTSKFTAVNGEAGWFKVVGFTGGNLWLVEKSTNSGNSGAASDDDDDDDDETHELTVAATAPTDGIGFFVGSVSFSSGVATVAQNLCGGVNYGGSAKGKTNDPQVIVGGYSETATPYNQLTDYWNRSSKKPVKLLVATRGTDNGTEGAIQFREALFDSKGGLVSVSDECDYAPIITAM